MPLSFLSSYLHIFISQKFVTPPVFGDSFSVFFSCITYLLLCCFTPSIKTIIPSFFPNFCTMQIWALYNSTCGWGKSINDAKGCSGCEGWLNEGLPRGIAQAGDIMWVTQCAPWHMLLSGDDDRLGYHPKVSVLTYLHFHLNYPPKTLTINPSQSIENNIPKVNNSLFWSSYCITSHTVLKQLHTCRYELSLCTSVGFLALLNSRKRGSQPGEPLQSYTILIYRYFTTHELHSYTLNDCS